MAGRITYDHRAVWASSASSVHQTTVGGHISMTARTEILMGISTGDNITGMAAGTAGQRGGQTAVQRGCFMTGLEISRLASMAGGAS